MKLYVDLFITGVALSWGPCLSFCAPILVPYIAGTQKGWLFGLKASLAFSLARIIPYAVLSSISVILGQFLIASFYQTGKGPLIYLVVGGCIALLGLIVLLGKSPHLKFCAPLQKLSSEGGIKGMILLGIVVGFAPCLPLLGVLGYIAFHGQNLMHGLLLGLTFGLGTLISPLILIGPVASEIPQLLFKKPLVYKIFSRICGLVLLYLGIAMLVGVWRAI